jgi:hypothetical protein
VEVVGVIALTVGLALLLGIALGRWLALVVAAFAWPAVALVMAVGDALGLVAAGRSQDDDPWFIAGIAAIYILLAIVGATLGVIVRKASHRLGRSSVAEQS